LGPLNFDCPFSSAEFGARLFIEQSRCDQLEDLALAGVRSSYRRLRSPSSAPDAL
jgi:hypothetical protein